MGNRSLILDFDPIETRIQETKVTSIQETKVTYIQETKVTK
jgi:hypothetical protein